MSVETIRGWRIAARHLKPATVRLLDDRDVPYEVTGLWDVIVVHEETGEAREFERVYFGANEPNMLAWCVEQIEAARVRAGLEAQRAEYEAARAALGLGETLTPNPSPAAAGEGSTQEGD